MHSCPAGAGVYTDTSLPIPQSLFMPCFLEYIETPYGAPLNFTVRYDAERVYFFQANYGLYKSADTAEEQQQFEDVRRIIETYAPSGTFFYSGTMVRIELSMFGDEVRNNTLFSFAAIFVAVLIFTGGVGVTLAVSLAIALEYLFVMASLVYWELDIDVNTFINVLAALGIVVDYCAHIAHFFQNHRGSRELSSAAAKRRQKIK